MKHLCDLLIMS